MRDCCCTQNRGVPGNGGSGSPPPGGTSTDACAGPVGASSQIKNAISNDAALKNLSIFLANSQLQPSFNVTAGTAQTNPNGTKTATTYDLGGNLITWPTGAIDDATARGQNYTQLVYHEMDHAAIEQTGALPWPTDPGAPASASAVIDGVTYTWTFAMDSSGWPNSAWYGYEHLDVHNDIVDNSVGGQNLGDTTGALASALMDSDNPPQGYIDSNNIAHTAKDHAFEIAQAHKGDHVNGSLPQDKAVKPTSGTTYKCMNSSIRRARSISHTIPAGVEPWTILVSYTP